MQVTNEKMRVTKIDAKFRRKEGRGAQENVFLLRKKSDETEPTSKAHH